MSNPEHKPVEGMSPKVSVPLRGGEVVDVPRPRPLMLSNIQATERYLNELLHLNRAHIKI